MCYEGQNVDKRERKTKPERVWESTRNFDSIQLSPTQLSDVINVQIHFRSAVVAGIMKDQELNGKQGSADGSQRRTSVFKKVETGSVKQKKGLF